MSQIRCPYCGHDNAAPAKFCSGCGGELHLPPHLTSCLRCGSINPVAAPACIWCHAKLPGPLLRTLRRPRTRAAVTATALVAVAVFGYYLYPRDSLEAAPRQPSVRDAGVAVPPPAPQAEPPSAEAPKAKAPVAAAVRPQASRKAGEPAATATETCTEGAAALGLCGTASTQTPQRPQGCTDAVAALGLCASNTSKGRE